MSKLFLGSIDLNKIKKEDIVTTDKDGNKFKNGAKYLNISIWSNDEPDQYGNHIGIKAGKKDDSYYIGNAKQWESNKAQKEEPKKDDDGLPF